MAETRIGISYWSKDGKEEFAVHEFGDKGVVLGHAQYVRKGDKTSVSGDNPALLQTGAGILAQLSDRLPK